MDRGTWSPTSNVGLVVARTESLGREHVTSNTFLSAACFPYLCARCRQLIEDYVNGGDGGLTEQHMRRACKMKPRLAKTPQTPGPLQGIGETTGDTPPDADEALLQAFQAWPDETHSKDSVKPDQLSAESPACASCIVI